MKKSETISQKPEGYKISGFKAAGTHCGIKKDGRKDLAIIYSEVPSKIAGVFTTNRVKGSHIPLDKERIKNGSCRAVVINSGCANTCMGEKGDEDVRNMTLLTAQALGIKEDDILAASTGKIGIPLPMDRVEEGIPFIVEELNEEGWQHAALAIMTTDTFPKLVLEKGDISGREVTLLGIAKGAGMIMPDMATMLAFFCTDAVIERDALDTALRDAADKSFNMITVDGDTSPNDTVLILANGRAENEPIDKVDNIAYKAFYDMLERASFRLARMIVEDGEGATKLLIFRVKGIKGLDNAKKLAFKVANSLLVKTAFNGNDLNWGRMISAIGSAKVDIDSKTVDIYIDDIKIVEKGNGLKKEHVKERLKKRDIKITIDLNKGEDEFTVLTTDLSSEYVSINAEYST